MKAPTIPPSCVAAFFSLAKTWLLLLELLEPAPGWAAPLPLLNTEPSSGLTLMLVKLVELAARDLRCS